jgi:polyphenol oxidase
LFFENRKGVFIGRFASWFGSGAVDFAMSTRRGGVSRPPFDALNLGLNTDDDPAFVEENFIRFCSAVGFDRGRIAFTRQVHGDRVALVQAPGIYADTDALITVVPGLVLTIQVADCVPIFFYDPVRRAAGAAHAGWKGSALEIGAKTVAAMVESYGARPSDLRALIGPSIGPCCYEVGPEVAGRFPSRYLSENKLDLWRFTLDSLLEAGLRPDHVALSGLCTRCHSEWFFSHRSSGGKTGRMLGAIRIPPDMP